MDKEVVLITGANTGIGYEVVRALAGSQTEYEIVLGSRSLEKADKALQDLFSEFPAVKERVTTVQIDIENDDSIEAAFELIKGKFGRLDVLVNNAGAQFDPQHTAGKITLREAWNKTWQVNTTSTHVTTTIFIPLLLESQNPRLMFLASGTSSFGFAENLDLPFNRVAGEGWPKSGLTQQQNVPAYRCSKTGLNMLMREWYRTLKNDGVKVWAISPGFLATGLGGNQEKNKQLGGGDPALGGQFIKNVIEGQRDHDVGKVILRDQVQPW